MKLASQTHQASVQILALRKIRVLFARKPFKEKMFGVDSRSRAEQILE